MFGKLGVCEFVNTVLKTYHTNAETVEAACRAIHYVANQNGNTQSFCGDIGIIDSLKNVLEFYKDKRNVCLSAVGAVYAVLKD